MRSPSVLMLLVCGVFRVGAAELYVAQSTAGSDTGASCANAHSAAWFNTAGNWGAGAGKINPGDTVHLCGTISTALTVQASGTVGGSTTILFELNAKMSAPAWNPNPAITVNGVDYITIDGGVNGIVEASNNGTALGLQLGGSAIYIYQANYAEVKNLTVRNIYVRVEGTDDINGAGGIYVYYSDHAKIHDNTISYCANCINYTYTAGQVDVQIYGNTISKASVGINFGSGGSGATVSGALIHDNNIFDTNIWDCTQPVPTANCLTVRAANHQNGMHIYAAQTGTSITNLRVYGNYLHGDIGAQSTAWIFIEGYLSGALVYNNLFYGTANSPANGYICLRGCAGCKVANNTIVSYITGSGGSFGVLLAEWTGTETGIEIRNNIGYGVGFGIYDSTGSGYLQQALAASNNNLFYSPYGTVQMRVNGGTWAAWQALGYDANSVTTDPLLDGSYKLSTSSPAIGAGANLTGLGITTLNTDRAGMARPSSGAWDIGAYQYISLSRQNGSMSGTIH